MHHDDSPTHRAAHEDLQYIRRTLAAAGHISSIPGRGMVAIGLLALLALAVNVRFTGAPWDEARHPQQALGVWAALLAISVGIGLWTMAQKARRTGIVFWSPVLRKAMWGYVAGMLLGGILTVAVIRAGTRELLPVVWLGCYGAAVSAAGMMSVSPVRWMGICFLILAAVAAFWNSPAAGLPLLALGFSWLHISFGAYIAWRHDG